ncbi:MAG TPA: hypothetical protein VE170_01005 [Candidatus Limnocylindria bacterium]|nr:hypothetical protein [Candidatus Limnocylindria bacterium]
MSGWISQNSDTFERCLDSLFPGLNPRMEQVDKFWRLWHTFATTMIECNKNPLWIANQMGTSLEMLFSTYAVYFQKRGWSQKWSQGVIAGGK